MHDLFATLPPPKPKVGHGNAMFLADLANNVSDDEMRRKFKAGEYPNLHRPSVPGWRNLAGRKAK